MGRGMPFLWFSLAMRPPFLGGGSRVLSSSSRVWSSSGVLDTKCRAWRHHIQRIDD